MPGSSNRAIARAVAELVEPRRHLSVAFERGILRLTGTPADDAYVATRDAGTLTVRENGVPHVFAAADVSRVYVRLGDGDDLCDLSAVTDVHARIAGGDGDDTLLGGGGGQVFDRPDSYVLASDVIEGGTGDDRIIGGPGDDVIRPGLGDDWADGGAGQDTLSYDDRATPIGARLTVDLDPDAARLDADAVRSRGEILDSPSHGGQAIFGDLSAIIDERDQLVDAEVLEGSAGDDVVVMRADDSSPWGSFVGPRPTYAIAGGAGNDSLEAVGAHNGVEVAGESVRMYVAGDDGDDRLCLNVVVGTGHALDGGDGHDTLLVWGHGIRGANGGVELPSLSTGEGFDTVDVQWTPVAPLTVAVHFDDESVSIDVGVAADVTVLGNDLANAIVVVGRRVTVLGDEGDDTITASGPDVVVQAGGGNDQIRANAGDIVYPDAMDRSAWRASIDAGYGRDAITTGPGPDVVHGGYGEDRVDAGGGNDHISGGAGLDYLHGREGRDVIVGGPGADVIYGDAGNDKLYGDAGDDAIFGGSGADHLSGGPHMDRLNGEGGDDTLDGGAGKNYLDGGKDADRAIRRRDDRRVKDIESLA